MVLDMITNPSLAPLGDLLTQTIEGIIDAIIESKNVLIEKKSFGELSSYLDRIVPLLRELNKKSLSDSQGMKNVVDILNRETKVAKQLIRECSGRNKVYLLVNCQSIAKRIENITREISRALSCIPLASLDIASGIKEEITQLVNNMHAAEFRASVAEEEILERIKSGIEERNVQRSYANNLLHSIAEAIGISTEKSVLKKEIDEFKKETENARLRKDHAEAVQMEQIIALLERADATYTHEDKVKKYFSKRKSLARQPLEPLQSFCCPITGEVMVDPVEALSGHTYERTAIEKWLADSKICPMTSTPLDTSMLRPNKTLQQSIEEWKVRNTMIIIANMRSKLLSEDEAEVLCSLEELRDVCEQREIHREWVILEGYIHILVKILGAKNREIRSLALVILCILAKDSDEAKENIVEVDNATESIVRSLSRRSGERKLAVELLLELSKHESLCDHIGKLKGCIVFLVIVLKSDDHQSSKDASDVLENLSFSDENVIRMAEANYFKHLLIHLSSGSDDVKMRMAKALAEIEFTDPNKSSLFEEGVLDSLLSLVSHDNIEMKKAAIGALSKLSSLPKNGLEMIRQGAVRPLLDILFRQASSQGLPELVTKTIMHLAQSTTCQDSLDVQISLLETNDDMLQLFSLINFRGPAVQQSVLRALYAICISPSAANVRAPLRECSAMQVLAQLVELDNSLVRADAVKLLCCLTEDCDDDTVNEHVEQRTIQSLLKIIQNSDNMEEITSAMGIISNLPASTDISHFLLEVGGIPIISRFFHDENSMGSHRNQLIENVVGVLCHFTVPTNRLSQKKVAETGIVSILVQLLATGTSLTKRRAANSLAQLSQNSGALSRPISKRQGFLCFSALPEGGCPVHQGICSVETSFCLVEADAVAPLARTLQDPDARTCEASLDALFTLINEEKLRSSCKVLANANVIPSLVKLLCSSDPILLEKVLSTLEKMFRLVEFKQEYGPAVQMSLVDLTQSGNNNIKSLAAKILAQLNVIFQLSSYF